LSKDLSNCGACGNVCPATEDGKATCSGGSCGVKCDSGYALCGGKCVDTDFDDKNCGECGSKCKGTCLLGLCL
jgi:hypothetical protein